MFQNSDDLHQIMQQNDMITLAYSRYLNHMPRFLTKEMVQSLANECGVDPHEAFVNLFAAACGIDTTDDLHRTLERNYIRVGLHRLEPSNYQNDAYCHAVKLPACKSGKWEMREESYAPYEPFVCNHPTLTPNLREIPQIGYFSEEFRFPAILENGVEWMTVTPNEIETMRQPIQKSRGHVLTLGLGLGYFAFHASEKQDVKKVTVIERDPEVIELFNAFILPQFPNAQKLEIIQADALEYMRSQDIADRFDYIFADLWHDQSDGLPLYLQLRQIEDRSHIQNMDYWIEPSLLSYLRHILYDKLTDTAAPLQLPKIPLAELLSDDFLRIFALSARLN